MTRIACAFEVALMTRVAIGRCSGIGSLMTGAAVYAYVTSFQRKGRQGVIKVAWHPGNGSMTGLTVSREICQYMVRFSCAIVGGGVATVTIRLSGGEISCMAFAAFDTQMGTRKRE